MLNQIAIVANKRTVHFNSVYPWYEAFNSLTSVKKDYFLVEMQRKQHKQVIDFMSYDAIIITHHIRPWLDGWGNDSLDLSLKRYSGPKVLFLHDEYEQTNNLKDWILEHQISHVYSVVPKKYLQRVYALEDFPNTSFESILTAYISDDLVDWSVKSLADRKTDIFYRGRLHNPAHGELSAEKYTIGEAVRARAEQRGFDVDISCDPNDRIAGQQYYERMFQSKATLATESGTNIFDLDGDIKRWFSEHRDSNLDIPESLNFRESNIGVRMNQLSPKMFEAIALRTLLILYEGEYSGILKPHKHYLPLKKDHSNLDAILDQLANTDELQHIVDTAYAEIVNSGEYSFTKFVETNLEHRLKSLSKTYQAPNESLSEATVTTELIHPVRFGQLKDELINAKNIDLRRYKKKIERISANESRLQTESTNRKLLNRELTIKLEDKTRALQRLRNQNLRPSWRFIWRLLKARIRLYFGKV